MAEKIKATTEVTFICADCGDELDTADRGGRYDETTTSVEVTPCRKCLKEASEEGYENGVKSAEEES